MWSSENNLRALRQGKRVKRERRITRRKGRANSSKAETSIAQGGNSGVDPCQISLHKPSTGKKRRRDEKDDI